MTMSGPLKPFVHYPQHTAKLDASSTTRSSWYDEEHDDHLRDHDHDHNENYSKPSSSSSSSPYGTTSLTRPSRQPDKEMIPFNMCWGGWFLKLTTLKKQQQQPFVSFSSRTNSKTPLKVVTSSSSATSLDDYDDDDETQGDQESSCTSGSTTPSTRHSPIASLSIYNGNDDDEFHPEDLGDDTCIIQSLQIEGERLEQQGLLVDALHVYQRLLELHRATGQSADQIGKIHYQTGMIQYKLGNYNESLCHFDQALFTYQLNYDPDHDDCSSHAIDFYNVYFATGHVHLSNHNPYRAIDYFHRALEFVQQLDQSSVTTSPSISSTSSPTIPSPPPPTTSCNDVNNNINNITETLGINQSTGNLYNQYYAQVLHALGTSHEAIGNDTEAMQYYQTAATFIVLPLPPPTISTSSSKE